VCAIPTPTATASLLCSALRVLRWTSCIRNAVATHRRRVAQPLRTGQPPGHCALGRSLAYFQPCGSCLSRSVICPDAPSHVAKSSDLAAISQKQ
jgi:hypothetical protein